MKLVFLVVMCLLGLTLAVECPWCTKEMAEKERQKSTRFFVRPTVDAKVLGTGVFVSLFFCFFFFHLFLSLVAGDQGEDVSPQREDASVHGVSVPGLCEQENGRRFHHKRTNGEVSEFKARSRVPEKDGKEQHIRGLGESGGRPALRLSVRDFCDAEPVYDGRASRPWTPL